MWDIPTGLEKSCYGEHTDFVRALATGNQLFVTGSYDKTVKLWDTRNASSSLTLEHGAPVESLLLMPSQSIVISAGDNYFKVWDILSGGKCLATICNHQKTITCMSLDATKTQLLTGSLDQHLKIYDVKDYSVVHTLKYPSPILSMAVSVCA